MTVAPDTYISAMLALAGWDTVPRRTDQRYPEVDLSAFQDVDHVLLSSEPFHFKEHHCDELRTLIPGADVRLVDGEMTSWYGSRAIAGMRYVAELTGSSPSR